MKFRLESRRRSGFSLPVAVGLGFRFAAAIRFDLKRLRAGLGWYGRAFYESEMARSSECTG